MADATMIFPPDFLWGTATAAFQVEGNNENSDWWPWEEAGNILHKQRSGPAADWWRNAEQDLDTAVTLGTNAHRLSVEWSRIEPEPSIFDDDALGRYREILQGMHDRGIEPMVTLHHFSNPRWLREKRDFNGSIITDYFPRYVGRVVDALGDLVPKWVTINEPMVYAFLRYLSEDFPAPARSGFFGAREALRNMLRCHALAYHKIKEKQPEALVGVAKNMAVIQPRPPGSRIDARWARFISWLFNDMWLEAVMHGRPHPILGGRGIPHLANTLDFLGVNYYTRFYVKFPPRGDLLDSDWGPDAVVSDGAYGEVYPQGLFAVLEHARRYGKPIYITENGVPDAKDTLRPNFLLTHLREVWRALNFSYPIMGYYHWSLVDNFEWDRGWTQRFGLIELDVETQERELRRSGELYGEICRSRSISSEMARQYAPELLKVLFRGEAPEPGGA
jgi:beta-glucosidase